MKIFSTMLLALMLTACTTASEPQASRVAAGLIDPERPIGGSRPVDVKTPPNFDARSGSRYPLLLLLHGYSSSAAQQDRYLGLSAEALKRGFVFAAPNGTVSGSQRRFWNAGEACCNFEGSTVDDVAYLQGLIQEMIERYAVDPKRVYVFGHSNGGFMAYRLACDASSMVTAVAGLAGSLRSDLASCRPERPVSVLAIHGTSDRVVTYRGGNFSRGGASYPSAEQTINHWASVNGCQTKPEISEPFNLLRIGRKPETTALRYSGCRDGVQTELWKMDGGSHIPIFSQEFMPRLFGFFEAAPRH